MFDGMESGWSSRGAWRPVPRKLRKRLFARIRGSTVVFKVFVSVGTMNNGDLIQVTRNLPIGNTTQSSMLYVMLGLLLLAF